MGWWQAGTGLMGEWSKKKGSRTEVDEGSNGGRRGLNGKRGRGFAQKAKIRGRMSFATIVPNA